MKLVYSFIAFSIIVACSTTPKKSREQIDLSGTWKFQLDSANKGSVEQWYLTDFADSVRLPGTTDSNQKGYKNTDTTTMHLNRVYTFEGAAWYQKQITIPESFTNKHIALCLERTKVTTIWIDTTKIGGSILLQSPQQFDVSEHLTPGTHTITIKVDNSRKLTPYGGVHIYADDTQTNWNGILGKMYIEATPKVYITNLQAYPDIANKKVDLTLQIANQQPQIDLEAEISVTLTVDGKTTELPTKQVTLPGDSIFYLSYNLSDHTKLWDEYNQPLYTVTVAINKGEERDSKTIPFGMREFSTNGTQFTINGRTTFLRGKNEAAVFPKTGYAPTDVEAWKRVYKIAKQYGINHYRFHSYCPPEAAFIAADEEGIFLQAETPFWGGLDADSIADMLYQEGIAMLNTYANHPSFVMFSHGNEIWGGHNRVEKNIAAFKKYDNRPLYTMGSNNSIGYADPRAISEFFVGARTPYNGHLPEGHTRLTHAFADADEGGILNGFPPSTNVKFTMPVEHMPIPIVSHEIGQYQIYPDYAEIDKYTGVLRAWNFEVFKQRLAKNGMIDQDKAFQQASGAWSALCYKAEMEAAFRTQGFAGFQLLDLQDFPGQGTALIGILDAFMDSKQVVSEKSWKQSCNDVVVLAEFPKYVYENNETFISEIAIANFSNKTLASDISWSIALANKEILAEGSLGDQTFEMGTQKLAGTINVGLSAITKAEEVTLNLTIPGTNYTNEYKLWVYPDTSFFKPDSTILIRDNLHYWTVYSLKKGATVLYMPSKYRVKGKTVDGHFPPEFWNYGMFKSISENVGKPVSPGTLGLLMDPDHPIFNNFPTDSHTNWQWFSVTKASYPLILDETDKDYRPIVQVIDNLERAHKLGFIFEFKVGEGKLLVCMAQLDEMKDDPVAKQLYESILKYMASEDFKPSQEISEEDIKKLL